MPAFNVLSGTLASSTGTAVAVPHGITVEPGLTPSGAIVFLGLGGANVVESARTPDATNAYLSLPNTTQTGSYSLLVGLGVRSEQF